MSIRIIVEGRIMRLNFSPFREKNPSLLRRRIFLRNKSSLRTACFKLSKVQAQSRTPVSEKNSYRKPGFREEPF
jgi:hypothetical protein